MFLEKLGYVKKDQFEKLVRESDVLKRNIEDLEEKISLLEAERSRLNRRIEFIEMAVPSTTKIRSIGPRTAQRLEEVGIKNILDLVEASPEMIADATGSKKEKALKIIKKATNLIKKQ